MCDARNLETCRAGAIGWRDSHLVVAAVGFAIAILSALLIQEPAREFPAEAVGAKSAVSESGDAAEPTKAAAINAVLKEAVGGQGGAEGAEGACAGELVSPEGGGEGGQQAEERESFQEALRIVFQSNTAKLVSKRAQQCLRVSGAL